MQSRVAAAIEAVDSETVPVELFFKPDGSRDDSLLFELEAAHPKACGKWRCRLDRPRDAVGFELLDVDEVLGWKVLALRGDEIIDNVQLSESLWRQSDDLYFAVTARRGVSSKMAKSLIELNINSKLSTSKIMTRCLPLWDRAIEVDESHSEFLLAVWKSDSRPRNHALCAARTLTRSLKLPKDALEVAVVELYLALDGDRVDFELTAVLLQLLSVALNETSKNPNQRSMQLLVRAHDLLFMKTSELMADPLTQLLLCSFLGHYLIEFYDEEAHHETGSRLLELATQTGSVESLLEFLYAASPMALTAKAASRLNKFLTLKTAQYVRTRDQHNGLDAVDAFKILRASKAEIDSLKVEALLPPQNELDFMILAMASENASSDDTLRAYRGDNEFIRSLVKLPL